MGPTPGQGAFSRLPGGSSSPSRHHSGSCKCFQGDYFKHPDTRTEVEPWEARVGEHAPCLTWFSRDSHISFREDWDKEVRNSLPSFGFGALCGRFKKDYFKTLSEGQSLVSLVYSAAFHSSCDLEHGAQVGCRRQSLSAGSATFEVLVPRRGGTDGTKVLIAQVYNGSPAAACTKEMLMPSTAKGRKLSRIPGREPASGSKGPFESDHSVSPLPCMSCTQPTPHPSPTSFCSDRGNLIE